MSIAAVMIALQAAPVSYLPLAAAWLGVAARWCTGAASLAILVLGEIAWFAFGILAGSTINIVMGSIIIAMIAATPIIGRAGVAIPRILSPSLI